MLEPADLRAAALLDSQVQERLPTVERATAPIYRDEPSRPVPSGSAVMLRIDDHRFALTAAHVADNSASFPLYIGSSTRPVRLSGTKIATKLKPGQRREDDRESAERGGEQPRRILRSVPQRSPEQAVHDGDDRRRPREPIARVVQEQRLPPVGLLP